MALNRLYCYGSADKIDADHVSAMIVFECPNAEAEGWQNYLYWSDYYTYNGGSTYPKCVRVKIEYNKFPNVAWLTAIYRTIRQPGRARLRGAVATRPIKAIYDTAGKTINGPVGDGYHIWRQTKGTNFQGQNHEVDILETTFASNPLSMLRSLRGCVNSDTMPNLGCQGDTVLVRGFKYKMMPYGTGIQWDVDLELWIVSGTGWNAACQRQQMAEVIQEMGVIEATTSGSFVFNGKSARKVVYLPKTMQATKDSNGIWTGSLVDSVEDSITPYPTASMGFLDSMLKLTPD